MTKINWILIIMLLTTTLAHAQNQKQVADKIVAVVGNEIVLHSDIAQKLQNSRNDTVPLKKQKCRVLNQSIQRKLLLTKAREDSVEVKSRRVEAELNRRIQYFIERIGSQSKLEDFYDKSIGQIKEQMREPTKEMLLTEKMKNQIVADVEITPQEVKQYFNNLPADSIPYFNTQVELGHIVRTPKPTKKAREKARQRLKTLRKRIVNEGESFDNLAILYSDDESSATDGGDLGMQNKSSLNSKLAAKALNLPKDTISGIFKTEEGFHIIKLLERKGDKIHVKHILKKPEITPKARNNAGDFLDSIKNLIQQDSLTFEKAAYDFSEDDQTNKNGGLIMNKKTGSNKIPVEQLNSEMFFNIDTMQVGTISKPVPMNFKGMQDAYRIVYLKNRTPPHEANLEQDYPRIRRQAEQKAKQKKLDAWKREYSDNTYIKIKMDTKGCKSLEPFMAKP